MSDNAPTRTMPTTSAHGVAARAAPARFIHLDFLRGVAALIVTAGHLRHFLFETYANMAAAGVQVGLFWKAFYFISGLSHESVIAFFALSGFLVGGKVLSDLRRDRFSWITFLLRRFSRLWIVILPTLALTFLFDRLGVAFSDGALYAGNYYKIYSSGPDGVSDLKLTTFLGNILFLQKIFVPTYGTNTPMWSLANEFWYYIFFAAAFWALLRRSAVSILVGLPLAAGVALLVPTYFYEGAGIWLAGACSAWIAQERSFHRVLADWRVRVACLAIAAAGIVLTKAVPDHMSDLALGLMISVALPALAHTRSSSRAYDATAKWLSDISYTLYLTHMPLVVAIVAIVFAPQRSVPNIGQFGIFLLLLTICLIWARAVWHVFERNTDVVYASLSKTFSGPAVRLSTRGEPSP